MICDHPAVIISHEHRYVFIELPRTGSSTINHELRRNYGGEWMLGKHSTYQDFLRVATPDERTYFAFAGIRNPLDVTVSRYVQVRTDARKRFTDPGKRARRTSLPEQIESRVFDWVRRNDASFEQFLLHWYWLPYDTWSSVDHRRLDFVVRFESLAEDFAEAIRRIGLTPKRKLPARNVTGVGRARWTTTTRLRTRVGEPRGSLGRTCASGTTTSPSRGATSRCRPGARPSSGSCGSIAGCTGVSSAAYRRSRRAKDAAIASASWRTAGLR